MDLFSWRDLAAVNLELTQRYMPNGGRLLDLGCGDGASSAGLSGVLVDYVKPKALKLSAGQQFVQSDLREFSTDEKFDVVTLYDVVVYFDRESIERLYHKCYGFLKSGGVLLIKHQWGKIDDIFGDASPEAIESHYKPAYLAIEVHLKLLRRAGFDIETLDLPVVNNQGDGTKFKLFVCKKSDVRPYPPATEPLTLEQARGNQVKLELLWATSLYLDLLDIPYYLMFGTLLGAVRDGDFIQWDTDVDIAILDRFQSRLIRNLTNCPLRFCRAGSYYCSLSTAGEYVDIYTYTDEGDKYSYCGGLRRYFDEEKRVFDNWSEIEFKGIKLRTVEDPETSLARWYGADWKTPKQKRICGSDLVPDRFE